MEGMIHRRNPWVPESDSTPNNASQGISLARIVHWEKDNTDYWIQWTVKDDETALWAYDPVDKKVVEVLRVREKPATDN